MRNSDIIGNQVFIGCPWKTIRDKYERVIVELQKKYPLAFVMVGRKDGQDAKDLFGHIKTKLRTSSYAVFDATGGNANVSLEFGLAEAWEIQSAIYVNVHGRASRTAKDSPIISDLAGKRRVSYKQERQLKDSLSVLSKDHPYTKRFDKFLETIPKGRRVHDKALALKLIHSLEGRTHVRRADVVDALLSEFGRDDIERVIRGLQKANLVDVSMGRYSYIQIA